MSNPVTINSPALREIGGKLGSDTNFPIWNAFRAAYGTWR